MGKRETMPPARIPFRRPSLLPNIRHHIQPRRQFLSDKPTAPSSSPPASAASTTSSSSTTTTASKQLTRLQRINSRLPRILQRWTTPLLRAPASQIVAFLLLHEATAVIPLFGLVGVMHYTNWLPPMAESAWVMAGVEKFGRYARKKGWLRDAEVVDAEARVARVKQQEEDEVLQEGRKKTWWNWSTGKVKTAWGKRDTLYGTGEQGVRFLVEFATAWAVVKALIVPRLALSVWATPWFARIAIEPAARRIAKNGGKLRGIFSSS